MVSTPHTTPTVVYVVFDRFPAPKGAAIHIAAFARALGAAFGPVELDHHRRRSPFRRRQALLRRPTLPEFAISAALPGVTHTPLPAPGRTVIDRAMAFRAHFGAWRRGRKFPIVHFRSIFEGYPLARHKSQVCDKLVFEVNGLPSIELKYHYPAVAEDRDLIAKLIAQEQCCIEAADLIVTVSDVTANHLGSSARGESRPHPRNTERCRSCDLHIPSPYVMERTGSAALVSAPSPLYSGERVGVRGNWKSPQKCNRIAGRLPSPSTLSTGEREPEGAALIRFLLLKGTGAPSTPVPIRLLYSGTLASWQGADRAIEALALLRRDLPATLTLIGPASRSRKDDLLRLADSLAVSAYARLLDPLPQQRTSVSRFITNTMSPWPHCSATTAMLCKAAVPSKSWKRWRRERR